MMACPIRLRREDPRRSSNPEPSGLANTDASPLAWDLLTDMIRSAGTRIRTCEGATSGSPPPSSITSSPDRCSSVGPAEAATSIQTSIWRSAPSARPRFRQRHDMPRRRYRHGPSDAPPRRRRLAGWCLDDADLAGLLTSCVSFSPAASASPPAPRHRRSSTSHQGRSSRLG